MEKDFELNHLNGEETTIFELQGAMERRRA